MERTRRFFKSILRSYRHIPGKKQYIEFFTALLTIPVLLTVIILNVSNLKNSQKPVEKASPDTNREVIINVPSPQSDANRVQPTASEPCNKALPAVSIAQPDEGDVVHDNPVAIDISYKKDGFCAIVWAYRINKGSWSNFDDKSIALFNLPKGEITVDIRVKSVVTAEEKSLARSFTYEGQSIDASPTKTASASSSL